MKMHDNERVSWTKVKREELVELNGKCTLKVSYDTRNYLKRHFQVLSDFMSKEIPEKFHRVKHIFFKLENWTLYLCKPMKNFMKIGLICLILEDLSKLWVVVHSKWMFRVGEAVQLRSKMSQSQITTTEQFLIISTLLWRAWRAKKWTMAPLNNRRCCSCRPIK